MAPDQSSLAAARKLLKASGWPTLAADGVGAVWGECQGSGAAPYRVLLHEADGGYKCSCPSRKFPCKHSLALMWMRAEGTASFTQGTPPPWVAEWLARRCGASAPATTDDPGQARPSIAALADDEAPGDEDPKAAARAEAQRERNRAGREALIVEGLAALDRWILDELERGLAGFDGRAAANCGTVARRLVDAKAGGLADRVAALPALLLGLDEALRGRVAA